MVGVFVRSERRQFKRLPILVGWHFSRTKVMVEFHAMSYEQGDGRPFWRYAVATATGCPDETYFEELYQVISFSSRFGIQYSELRLHMRVFDVQFTIHVLLHV